MKFLCHIVFSIIFSFLFLDISAQSETEQLSILLDSIITKYNIPGASCAVISDDKIEYGLAGETRLKGGVPITKSSVFHIGSCTKSFAGLIAMNLKEKGKLTLDDRLVNVVPELGDKIRKSYKTVTLGELLSHRAGVLPFLYSIDKEFENLPEWKEDDPDARLKFAIYALNLKPVKSPQKSYVYSNGGIAIAALMLERISGKTWEVLVQDYLEMYNWNFMLGFPNRKNIEHPWGHKRRDNGTLFEMHPKFEYELSKWLTPAGDMALSIQDFAGYVQSNLIGLRNGNDYLSKEGYEELHYSNDSYALGWKHTSMRNGKRMSSHNGSTGLFYCEMLWRH